MFVAKVKATSVPIRELRCGVATAIVQAHSRTRRSEEDVLRAYVYNAPFFLSTNISVTIVQRLGKDSLRGNVRKMTDCLSAVAKKRRASDVRQTRVEIVVTLSSSPLCRKEGDLPAVVAQWLIVSNVSPIPVRHVVTLG